MLTPAFEILQDHESVTIVIAARLAKISETEIFIEDDEFKFYSHPYFLRLTLPGKVVEDGTETGSYDVDEGKFVIRVPKQTPGEHFEGLDMLTKLLAPKKYTTTKAPLIEVEDDAVENGSSDDTDDNDDDDDEFDWQIEQTLADDVTKLSLLRDHYGYGFANQRSDGLPPRILAEYSEALDLSEPEATSPTERRRMRQNDEGSQFDPEHYLADFYQDECVEECLNYQAACRGEYRLLKQGHNPEKFIQFSDTEKEQLRSLPRKDYLVDSQMRRTVYLGLVDLVFAQAYDERTTVGESHVESGWTIRKLSSTLSWFETFTSVKQVVIASMRRSLCFPLYRHWRLARSVLRDTKYIFRLGKKRILRSLLETRRLLRERDPFFVLNDLYVDDYCVWLQGASDRKLARLSRALDEVEIEKSDLDLDLDDLERAAELALESEEEADGSETETETDNSDCKTDENESESDSGETENVRGTGMVAQREVAENISGQLERLNISECCFTKEKDQKPLIEEISN